MSDHILNFILLEAGKAAAYAAAGWLIGRALGLWLARRHLIPDTTQGAHGEDIYFTTSSPLRVKSETSRRGS